MTPVSQRYETGTDDEREKAVAAASLAIQRGELVIVPTDTVYGIAADAFDSDAVEALLDAKERGRDMPVPVLVSSATTLDALAVKVPAYARVLVEAFWPGPLTVVCHQQSSLKWDLGDTRGTVALRMPDHPVTLEILERTGPLAVSSANLSGRPAATTAAQAEEMLGDEVDVVVDAGPSAGAAASTILDATGPEPRVLRQGALSRARLEEALVGLGLGLGGDGADPDPADAMGGAPAADARSTLPAEDPDEGSDAPTAGTPYEAVPDLDSEYVMAPEPSTDPIVTPVEPIAPVEPVPAGPEPAVTPTDPVVTPLDEDPAPPSPTR